MHPLKKPIILFLVLAVAQFVFTAAKSPYRLKKITRLTSSYSRINNTKNASALFNEMHLAKAGMKQTVFNSALQGLEKLDEQGLLKRNDIITIVDFSQPSNKKRLYVLDLVNKQLLFNTLVAHGMNSGKLWAKSFSNKLSSLKSSPGFYVTAETYVGDNGYSLRLDGLEKNINDNARDRAIVMHGAPYVNQSAIKSLGFLGRSWGCPAIPLSKHRAIINAIKDGTCLFIYSPNKKYLENSPILNS